MNMNQIWILEDPNDLIIALCDHLCNKCQYGDEISVLSPAERVFYVTQGLEMEVNNGGFSQYFFNSAGNFANELPEAYEELGAVKTAELCRRAMSFFGTKVPTDRGERQECMDDREEEADELFEECDDAFYAYEEDLETLTYEYVLRNKDAFT